MKTNQFNESCICAYDISNNKLKYVKSIREIQQGIELEYKMDTILILTKFGQIYNTYTIYKDNLNTLDVHNKSIYQEMRTRINNKIMDHLESKLKKTYQSS